MKPKEIREMSIKYIKDQKGRKGYRTYAYHPD